MLVGSGLHPSRARTGARRIQEPQTSKGWNHLTLKSPYERVLIGDACPTDVTQNLCLTGPGLPVGKGGDGTLRESLFPFPPHSERAPRCVVLFFIDFLSRASDLGSFFRGN